jgi:hypothetical protein
MMTKKAIREVLAPLSKALLRGADAQRVELLGFQVECNRLNNAPGCVGFAWHPHFTAYQNGRVRTGGNLREIVDRLALLQTA